MKLIDYLYFGIYNSYYKDGNFNNDIPWYTSMMIFGAMLFLNVIFIINTISTKEGYPINKNEAFLLGGLCLTFSYFMFGWRKRYLKVYQTFCNLSKSQRLVNKIVSWSYCFFSFFLAILPPLKQMILRMGYNL